MELDFDTFETQLDSVVVNPAPSEGKLLQNLKGESRFVVVKHHDNGREVRTLTVNTKGIRQGQGADYHNFPVMDMFAVKIEETQCLVLRDHRDTLRTAASAVRNIKPNARKVEAGMDTCDAVYASNSSDPFRTRKMDNSEESVRVYGREFWFGRPIVHAQVRGERKNSKLIPDSHVGESYSQEDDRHALFVSFEEMEIFSSFLDSIADGQIVDSELNKDIGARRDEFRANANRLIEANRAKGTIVRLIELSGFEAVPTTLSVSI